LVLTYGEVVSQIIRDCNMEVSQVNAKLEDFGYKIGKKLVDDYFAKTGQFEPCSKFERAAEVIASKGLTRYLGVTGKASFSDRNIEEEIKENQAKEKDKQVKNLEIRRCIIAVSQKCPLEKYVVIPPSMDGLVYSNLVAGAIKGALEVLDFKTRVHYFPQPTGALIQVDLIEKVSPEIYQYDKDELR